MNRHRSGFSLAGVAVLLFAWALLCGGGLLHDLAPHHPMDGAETSCCFCRITERNGAETAPALTAPPLAPSPDPVVSVPVMERIVSLEHEVSSPRAPPLPA